TEDPLDLLLRGQPIDLSLPAQAHIHSDAVRRAPTVHEVRGVYILPREELDGGVPGDHFYGLMGNATDGVVDELNQSDSGPLSRSLGGNSPQPHTVANLELVGSPE